MIESLESRQLMTLTLGPGDGLVPYVEHDYVRPAVRLAPTVITSNYEIQRRMSAFTESETLTSNSQKKSSDTNNAAVQNIP